MPNVMSVMQGLRGDEGISYSGLRRDVLICFATVPLCPSGGSRVFPLRAPLFGGHSCESIRSHLRPEASSCELAENATNLFLIQRVFAMRTRDVAIETILAAVFAHRNFV